MSEADRLRNNMSRLDKKVSRLNQMITNLDKEMRSKRGTDAPYSHQSICTDPSEMLCPLEHYDYEFKFVNERGELQRNSESKPAKSSVPRDDFFSFYYPVDGSGEHAHQGPLNTPPLPREKERRRPEEHISKSATKETDKE